MRILQVVTLLTPEGAFGGPARVALNQCVELTGRGHEVTLAAATRGYRVKPTTVDGVRLRLFDARIAVPRAGLPGTAAPGLGEWIRTNRAHFDALHIHFGRDLVSLPAAALARRHHIPYVLQPHGMVVPSGHPFAGPLDLVWTSKLLRDADAVLYLTDREREQLAEVARMPLRFVLLHNGVPEYSEAGLRPRGVPEVLFVARIHARKRPLTFVQMAKELLGAGMDARFVLVGPDEGEGPAVRAATEGHSHISWEGAVKPDAIPARMAAASVFVLPSVREPYPMSVLEAMSVGLPVVIAGDCGLAPVVDKARCGTVVDGGADASAYAAAVKALLLDRTLAQAMGQRARRTAQNDFGMSAIGDRLEAVYTSRIGAS